MKINKMEQNIKEQYKSLGCHGNGDDSYKVLSLKYLPHKLGKSSEGYPMFLFVSMKPLRRSRISLVNSCLWSITNYAACLRKRAT